MTLDIKILGTGCAKCQNLYQLTNEVVTENNIQATIEKVEDIEKIMEYEVMNTPALVVDNKVVVKGRVPNKTEILEFISSGKKVDEDNSSCCCSSDGCC